MKKKLLLFCLVMNFVIYSQSTKGIVTYKVKYIEPTKSNKSNNGFNNFMTSISNGFEYLDYKLLFNSIESRFELEKSLIVENNRSIRRAKILAGNAIYYSNIKENVFFKQIDFAGDMYLVNLANKPMNWKITKQQKMIQNFICYKAEAVKIVNNGYNIKVKITAWFTPKIPISFGPKGYFGLPGLILELQDVDVLYYASDIVSKLNTNINRPSKGIKIDEAQLEKKAEAAAMLLFNFKKSD